MSESINNETAAALETGKHDATQDLVIRLLEQALEQLRGHRHDFKGFLQNFSAATVSNITANKQIDEVHSSVKVAQGFVHAYSSIPSDVTEIKNSLIGKATDRTGIPYPIVMLLLVLFAVLVAIPTWLPIIAGQNFKMNFSREGATIESQEKGKVQEAK